MKHFLDLSRYDKLGKENLLDAAGEMIEIARNGTDLAKGKILAKKVDICQDIWRKAVGFMFSRKDDDKGLVFVFEKEQIVPLHMLFVFFPIDVMFLDKNKKVVEITKLRPWKFYTPKNKAKYIVEVLDAKNTKVGDVIEF